MSVLQQFSLNGKIALVTGCNKGIGFDMAVGLAEAGADIIGVSATLAKEGSEIEKAVLKCGKKFYAYRCNMSDRSDIYRFIEQVNANHPIIDILVNNAGTIKRKPAVEHDDALWDEVLAINLDAPFILSKAIAKNMLERGEGKIIFTCSLLTFQGGITVPGYASSKGALGSLIKALSNEWAGKGINVNGIAPGYIATDNTQALRDDEVRNKTILDRIPAGRWGVPEDFKAPLVFLASDAAKYVHGTILVVDGGWMGR